MKYKLLTLLLLLLVAGCVDPIDFDQKDQQEHLVVEASFTNADSSYVRLSYSQPYSVPFNKYETNASVYIDSEEGEHISFVHTKSGLYFPAGNEQGVVGHTYQLHVQVGDKAYASEPMKLREPVPIDSVYFEFDEVLSALEGQKAKSVMPGYNVYVDYTDPAGGKNFYRWSTKSVYEVLTQPWDFVECCCRGCPRPAPKPCCGRCWVYDRGQEYIVEADRLTNGKKVKHQQLHFVPFESKMHVKYKLTVYQHAISEEAYNFFRVLEQQRQTSGTVFDPPPSQLKGNMYNPEDEDEQVLGYFDASAVSVKEVVVERKDLDYDLQPYVYPDDCREIKNATTRKPEDW